MRIEFPLKHIDDNLVFNRNDDVWSYFEVDRINTNILNEFNNDIHIYISNELNKKVIGIKLDDVYGGKTNIKTNVKSFFEGLTAQVNKSVGLEPYKIIKDDILDFKKQTRLIENKLKENYKVNKFKTIDIISSYEYWLNLGSENEGGGLLDLNGISLSPLNLNGLIINNALNEVEPNYVQYLTVNKTKGIEYLVNLEDIEIPIEIFIRRNENKEFYTIIRITAINETQLNNYVSFLYDYSHLLEIDIYTPLGEQFILLYESLFGSDKTSDDYMTKIIEQEVLSDEFSNTTH